MKLDRLKNFRQSAYSLLGNARDAIMDLLDAVIGTSSVHSFAELSLSPFFRRKWPSLYEALEDGQPDREELMKLYIEQIPRTGRVILAGDPTAGPRLYAETLKDRTFEHEPKTLGDKPITLGHGYSTLAWIPESEGSWAMPLRHERITSFDSPLTLASSQLRQVCESLPVRPLSLWDSEYGCAPFLKLTADIEADKILRLRSNRCLFTAPPPSPGKKGRPKKHGDKFQLSNPQTWPTPVETVEIDDPKWGKMEIKRWEGLHFRSSADIPMTIVLIQRKGPGASASTPKPIWLACLLSQEIPLSEFWPLYQLRFHVDHWYRFAKQRLHWTRPLLSTPEQGQSWSDLMPLLTWQLWLAREIVQDNPLPWQKPLPQESLSPGRVARAFVSILAVVGTPAPPPKPRGKSPGWPKGRKQTPRIHYPTVKKRYSPPRAAKKSSA
jgi:hypothetical protein